MRTLAILMAVLCALAAGCASTARWDKEYAEAPEPVRTDWQLVKDRCGSCHSLERVFTKLHTYEDREDTLWVVEDMASKRGSGIRPDEYERLTDTLEWYRNNR